MRTIKLLVVALFVALAGAAYAAGGAQEAAHTSHAAKAGCCKAHKQDAKRASHSCDMKAGKGCCSGGSCCAAHQSEGARAANAAAQGTKKEGACRGCCEGHKAGGAQAATATQTGGSDAKAGCCGGECCKDCCKSHKGGAETKPAAAAKGGESHSCCASCGSCCKAQVARR